MADRLSPDALSKADADFCRRRVYGSRRASVGCNAALKTSVTRGRAELFRLMLEDCQRWRALPPVRTDEACRERILEYFESQCKMGMVPTVEGLALALGVSRKTVYRWGQGDQGAARRDMVKKAKEVLASLDASLVADGLIPPVVYIFRAKNYYGLVDEVEISPDVQPCGASSTEEEIIKKYASASDEAAQAVEDGAGAPVVKGN